MSYYADKTDALKRLFAAHLIEVRSNQLVLDDRTYPIINDVIVALAPDRYPPSVAHHLSVSKAPTRDESFSDEIQRTFGIQWQKFNEIMPEHKREFASYFDLVDITALENSVVLDLGCGMGRWSYFLARSCAAIVLVDFSEAIFAARRTLSDHPNAIFVMADIHALPFGRDSADFAFSLGVLHHMPTDALQELSALRALAPRFLVYLYYALDNRPVYFRWVLSLMNAARSVLGGLRNEMVRDLLVLIATILVYLPLAGLARALHPVGLDRYVPLHTYQRSSFRRIRQDAYDKLMTRIEQRFSRKQIEALEGISFSKVSVSDHEPYWHFLCER
jgi:SAM-dependent methyltransferase